MCSQELEPEPATEGGEKEGSLLDASTHHYAWARHMHGKEKAPPPVVMPAPPLGTLLYGEKGY